MSRQAEYLVFATEQYRFAKGLSGAKFIMDSFELFHIEREENMIAAVDDFIARQKKSELDSERAIR